MSPITRDCVPNQINVQTLSATGYERFSDFIADSGIFNVTYFFKLSQIVCLVIKHNYRIILWKAEV